MLLITLKKNNSTLLSLLFLRVSKPISLYKFSVGVLIIPPVIILNALLWTDSSVSSSVSEQLQYTILPCSIPDRIKEVYIVIKLFLSTNIFSFANIFNFLFAFSLTVSMWSFHDKFEVISIPKCLWLLTVSKTVLFNDRGKSKLWVFFVLSVTVRALLLAALNLTNQFSAHWLTCNKSSFSCSVASFASPSMVTYNDVSSAKSLIFDLIFSIMSLI